ncbi:MAG: glycoside hydrolase family 13 protein [Thermosphaera sp.]
MVRKPVILVAILLVAMILVVSSLMIQHRPPLETADTQSPTTTTASTGEKHVEEVYVSMMTNELKCQPPNAPVYFAYTPFPNETVYKVSLAGDFTGWTPVPMDRLDNGTWVLLKCLPVGIVTYKYLINDVWVKDMSIDHYGLPVDPDADGYVDDGYGGKNAIRRVVFPSETLFFIHVEYDPVYISIADDMVIVRLYSSNAKDARLYVIVGNSTYNMKIQLWTDYVVVWYRELPLDEYFTYYFEADMGDRVLKIYKAPGEKTFNSNISLLFKQVPWVRSAVGYQIFPDRFYNGDPSNDVRGNETDELWLNELVKGVTPVFSAWNDPITSLHCCHQYFGGDLAGVYAKLDYLEGLGVKMIYLNPIFLSGSVHGYDPYDYTVVDPKYGNETILKLLLDEAHKRGMKVIFDFVPNHVGIGFWAFLDVYRNGPQSQYWNWFIIKKWPFKLGDPTAYECWWGFGSLPKLNHSNPEVKQYLFNVVLQWLEFGFDGFRIDAPLEVLEADSFYRELRSLVKERFPDAYIVAEIWTLDPEWLRGHHFDSFMNYALGRDILLEYAAGRKTGDQVFRDLFRYYSSIPVSVAGMGFNNIGSHDTSRILTDLGGGRLGDTPSRESIDRLRLLVTLQFMLPGMPVVFQGDERGLLGSSRYYDEQRYPIQWDKMIPDVYHHYSNLSRLKAIIPALQTSVLTLHSSNGSIVSFFRGYANEVLVVANNALNQTVYQLPSGTWVLIYPGEPRIVEREVSIDGLASFLLLRYEYAIELGLIG